MDEFMNRKQNEADKYYKMQKEKEYLSKDKKGIDSAYSQLQFEIYSLIDANKNDVDEFNDRFTTTENKIINESASLKDIKEYWFDWIKKSKIRMLKQYRTRYAIMKEKVDNWKRE